MNPVQKRTGSASASSHDSHDVAPRSRAAAQLDNSWWLTLERRGRSAANHADSDHP